MTKSFSELAKDFLFSSLTNQQISGEDELNMKNYISLYAIQLCYAFAVAILSIALISMVFNSGGSVAVLMIFMALPSILFSRTIGGLLDKYNMKKMFAFAILLLFISHSFPFALILFLDWIISPLWFFTFSGIIFLLGGFSILLFLILRDC